VPRTARDIHVRPERPGDIDAIHAITAQAFGRPAEAHLVDALRDQGLLALSLVAADAEALVGHVAFSPVDIVGPEREWAAAGLAPVAVRPDRQRRGIGDRLIREGFLRLREAGVGIVVVVGHPDYYPRFGFVPASRHGITFPAPVPDEAFRVRELRVDALAGVGGEVRYAPPFDALD